MLKFYDLSHVAVSPAQEILFEQDGGGIINQELFCFYSPFVFPNPPTCRFQPGSRFVLYWLWDALQQSRMHQLEEPVALIEDCPGGTGETGEWL